MEKKKPSFFDKFVPALINILEREIVKAVLIKVVGSTVGFKAWLIKFVIEEVVIDEIIIPGVDYGERKLILFFDKAEGRYVYKKLEEASASGNVDDWRAAARRM